MHRVHDFNDHMPMSIEAVLSAVGGGSPTSYLVLQLFFSFPSLLYSYFMYVFNFKESKRILFHFCRFATERDTNAGNTGPNVKQ